jgi:hypothetical protein
MAQPLQAIRVCFPKITGGDQSEFEGNVQQVRLSRLPTYETPRPLLPGVPSSGRLVRRFCIDAVRNLILREDIESPPAVARRPDRTQSKHHLASAPIVFGRAQICETRKSTTRSKGSKPKALAMGARRFEFALMS